MMPFKILDGAMGSELIKRGLTLPKHIWSADANINYPELVLQIHGEYVGAGADYITTNTFRTTPRAYLKTGINSKKASQMAKYSLVRAIELAKKLLFKEQRLSVLLHHLKTVTGPICFQAEMLLYQSFLSWGSGWLRQE